jgi:hypothetical protein
LENYLEAKPVTHAEDDEKESDSSAPDMSEEDTLDDDPELEAAGFSTLPPKRSTGAKPWTTAMGPKEDDLAPELTLDPEPPKLKLGIKAAGPQSELSLDTTPRGRFEGENPNVFEGEDLDLPPFLRKKK